jgi:hypothetical protein
VDVSLESVHGAASPQSARRVVPPHHRAHRRRRRRFPLFLLVAALLVSVAALSAWVSEGDRLGGGGQSTATSLGGLARLPGDNGGDPGGRPGSPTGVVGGLGDLRPPIRAAFYYAWYPEAWNQNNVQPFTHYGPLEGFYDSADLQLIRDQITAMSYGGFDAGISSWWGAGSPTDRRFAQLLQAGEEAGFPFAPYYEAESLGDPSPLKIREDLGYIQTHYGTSTALLRLNGRIVVFVFGDPADGCGLVDRWREAERPEFYVVLKVVDRYQTCKSQPDAWHQYAPAAAYDAQLPYAVTISPGFWKADEPTPRLKRDLTRWRSDVKRMAQSGATFQLVTSFNEWGEGTAVEAATQWSSPSGFGSYLDILHEELGGR